MTRTATPTADPPSSGNRIYSPALRYGEIGGGARAAVAMPTPSRRWTHGWRVQRRDSRASSPRRRWRGGHQTGVAIEGSTGSLTIAPPPPPRHGGQVEDTAMVLNIGNLMNAGTLNGGVEAFKFESSPKLSQTKSAVGKTTILDYIVKAFIEKGDRQSVQTQEVEGRENGRTEEGGGGGGGGSGRGGRRRRRIIRGEGFGVMGEPCRVLFGWTERRGCGVCGEGADASGVVGERARGGWGWDRHEKRRTEIPR